MHELKTLSDLIDSDKFKMNHHHADKIIELLKKLKQQTINK
jgi:hypothetical protein